MVVFQWEEGDGVEDYGKEEDGKRGRVLTPASSLSGSFLITALIAEAQGRRLVVERERESQAGGYGLIVG